MIRSDEMSGSIKVLMQKDNSVLTQLAASL